MTFAPTASFRPIPAEGRGRKTPGRESMLDDTSGRFRYVLEGEDARGDVESADDHIQEHENADCHSASQGSSEDRATAEPNSHDCATLVCEKIPTTTSASGVAGTGAAESCVRDPVSGRASSRL